MDCNPNPTGWTQDVEMALTERDGGGDEIGLWSAGRSQKGDWKRRRWALRP
jgi:hypothetical protein